MSGYFDALSLASTAYRDIERADHHPCHRDFAFYCRAPKGELPSLDEINALLHSRSDDPWPAGLIAFCSNRSNNFWAFDLNDGQLKFIDERYAVAKNLDDARAHGFNSFGDWMDYQFSLR
jgi:hypothetical protein